VRYLSEEDLPEVFKIFATIIKNSKYTADQINDPQFVKDNFTRIFDYAMNKFGTDDKDDFNAACISTMIEYEGLSEQMKFITHHAKDALMRLVQERRNGSFADVIPETRYCCNDDCTNPLPYDALGNTKQCLNCMANNVGRKQAAQRHRNKLKKLRLE